MTDDHATPPDFSEQIITDPKAAAQVAPMARLHFAFRTLDGNFRELAESLQAVETERAQLTWALLLMVQQSPQQRITITKGQAEALDPHLVLRSIETPMGWTFWVEKQGETDATGMPAGVTDQH